MRKPLREQQLTVDGVDLALRANEAEWKTRLQQSRQALSAWRHEAGLPWADREMTAAIAETEIATLQGLIPQMPSNLRAEAQPLVHDWDALRLMLL